MRCAPLTRLGLALDAADPSLVEYAQAAEKAQLDFVTLPAGAPGELVDAVAAATSRIGVLGSRVAAGVPERSGVVLRGDGVLTGPGRLEPASVVAVHGPVVSSGFSSADVIDVADVFFVAGSASAAEVDALRDAAVPRTVRVFADLTVSIDPLSAIAAETGSLTAEVAGTPAEVAGTPAEVMAELGRRKAAAGLDGFRLHPATPATDVPAILTRLVPLLRQHDAFRRGYETRTLRGHLALPQPAR